MMTDQRKSYSRAAVSTSLAFLGIVVMSMTMRSGATSIGPLLGHISQAYHAGAGALGVLSALPCLVFAGVGLMAVPMSKRWGMSLILTLGTFISGLGLLLRPWAGNFTFFCVLSVVALVGPALANVLVPAWIKYHEAGRGTLLVTAYGTLLLIGGAFGSALAVPLAGKDGSYWQYSLATWVVFAFLAGLVWIRIAVRTGKDRPDGVAERAAHEVPTDNESQKREESQRALTPRLPIYRSRTAIALVLGFGLQSLNAYVQFAFLPQILINAGYSESFASLMAALVNLWAVVGGLVIPFMIDTVGRHIPWLAAFLGLLAFSGWIGLAAFPGSYALIWVSLLAIGGFTFPLILALIPARSRDAAVTADLSALVQPIGYIIAAVGPIGFGLLLQSLGNQTIPLIAMSVTGLLMGVATFVGAGTEMIDDELEV